MDEEKLRAARMEAEARAKAENMVQMVGQAGRESARGALRRHVERLRREADRLEALDRALPLELPPLADEALGELMDLLWRHR